jgi:replication factor C large subunit
MTNFQLWVDKYAPKSLDEIVGHTENIEDIRNWMTSWQNGESQEPLLLHGPTGVGKSATVTALANEFDLEVLELNASDLRSKERISRIAGHASVSKTFTGKTRLIFFDEVDGLYREDTGGVSAIVKVLKESKCPVVLTANDIWDPKLSSIRSAVRKIEMKKVHYATITKHLQNILAREEKNLDRSIVLDLSRRVSGDIRSAINDLQLLVYGMDVVTKEDVKLLGERDRKENIFNTIRTILKTRNVKKSREALLNLEEEPGFILRWIEENVPKEYTKPEDLYRAFDKISRADIFLGRVWRRQYYGLWRYASDMMSAGVSLSKTETYKSFTRYSFPSSIRYLSASKPDRGLRKSIAIKIAKLCHTSTSKAIKDYLPMLIELMKDRERSIRLAAQFEFTEEELTMLGVKTPAGVVELAEELRTEAIRSRQKPDRNQRALGQF